MELALALLKIEIFLPSALRQNLDGKFGKLLLQNTLYFTATLMPMVKML